MRISEYIRNIVYWKNTIALIVKNENLHSNRRLEKAVRKLLHKENNNQARSIIECNKKNELTYYAVHSSESGITTEKLCNEEVIVSLTTHGQRYYEAYLSIESIMQGTIRPNRIILWAPEELKDEAIPIVLQNQQKRGLEIRYVRDLHSHTKLIYALKEFPDAAIITIDDDLMYDYDIVENLVNAHNKKPGYICSNWVKPVPNDLHEHFLPLSDWDKSNSYMKEYDRFISYGFKGVLYPPGSFSNEVFNEAVFLDICKHADDVWFSAMAMYNKTKALFCYPHLKNMIPIMNSRVQAIGLTNINDYGEVLNNDQIKAVFSKYRLCGF